MDENNLQTSAQRLRVSNRSRNAACSTSLIIRSSISTGTMEVPEVGMNVVEMRTILRVAKLPTIQAEMEYLLKLNVRFMYTLLSFYMQGGLR